MLLALLAALGVSTFANPRVTGTFIQDWYFIYWDAPRWEKEIKMFKDLGMEYVILQTTIIQQYQDQDQVRGPNWELYELQESQSRRDYPSEVFDLYYSTHDSLKLCFEACRKFGLKVFIGCVYDTRWWFYGWDITNINYFKTWVDHHNGENKKAIEEIWSMYSEYRDVMAGWYNVNEIWNVHSACLNLDDNKYAEVIGAMLHNFSQTVNSVTPDLPMMVSPFVNYELTTAEQNGQWWYRLLKAADLRPIDIVAPQDSFGAQHDRHPDALDYLGNWIKSWSEGVRNNSVRFWINHENFRTLAAGGASTGPIEEFKRQISIAAPYVEKHMMFALSHYGSLYDSDGKELDPTWYNALKEYQEELKTPAPTPSPDAQGSPTSKWVTVGVPVGVVVILAAAGLGFVLYRRSSAVVHEIQV